ncbi:hypothetical protein SAMN05216550_12373 [Paraburkholderia tropica]|uniref:Uncharacterized protein n=1 Tax=Paraburkholderia tropica TaxID=92647 RepID=A0AAQ1JXP9_9BURK|nr:hypothetical protein SAMN05216550_12373 [Paraburkholderia tropica]
MKDRNKMVGNLSENQVTDLTEEEIDMLAIGTLLMSEVPLSKSE